MALRQFTKNDTDKWKDAYGKGSDGAYAPDTGTDAPIDSACTGTATQTSLTATNASFAAGQLILIHQTQGTGAGNWELNKIQSYTAGTITLSYALMNSYATGAQVLVMPQYTSGLIDTGKTLTTKAWNGTVGGIYAKFFKESFTLKGTLITKKGNHYEGHGSGYPGGNSFSADLSGQSYQGASYHSNTTTNRAATANNGGGGGGSADGKSGGGGGYATQGGTPLIGGGSAAGGTTYGEASLVTMFLGSGGGSGSQYGDDGGASGGDGGGIVLIISKNITIDSGADLDCDGSIGKAGLRDSGAGGGGSGGSILLKGQVLSLGTAKITAAGGTTVANQNNNSKGGVGGVGRIHADYSKSITGTTSPTIDSTQDETLKDRPKGGAFLLNML